MPPIVVSHTALVSLARVERLIPMYINKKRIFFSITAAKVQKNLVVTKKYCNFAVVLYIE